MSFGLGWRPELEARHAVAFQKMCRSTPLPGDEKIPASLDPRAAMTQFCRNQGSFSSCSGHARAKATGFCNLLDSGTFVDISPRFDYLTNLMVDGNINGGDNGASISGSALASQKYGEPLETDCPYWSNGERFNTQIPQDTFTKAVDHRILSVQKMGSCDESIIAMGTNQGAIVIGIDWTTDLANNTSGIITSQRGRSLGGHALAIFGYALHEGLTCPLMWNSHGAGWGQNGCALVHPKLFDRWCQGYHGVYLLSDLEEYTPRPRDFGDFSGVFGKGIAKPWSFDRDDK